MYIDAFQVIADPTRRRIVETLLQGEAAVNDILARVEIQQSGVSRHLRILHEAGFVQVRPDGQKRLYSLCPEPFQELNTWIQRYQLFWEARLEKFAAALERRQKARARKEKAHERRARS
jgi:DNA-binding transcriptional ArsR family regulator